MKDCEQQLWINTTVDPFLSFGMKWKERCSTEEHKIYVEYMEEIHGMELQYIGIQSFTLLLIIIELKR